MAAERVTLPDLEDMDPSETLNEALKSAGPIRGMNANTGQKTAPRTRQKASLVPQLTQMYTMLGVVSAMPLRNKPLIPDAIIANAEQCAIAVNDLAQTNPKIYNAIQKMMTGGASYAVFMAHMPIIMAIVAETLPAARNIALTFLGEDTDETKTNAAA